LEYKPSDFGYNSEQDFRGRYNTHEGLIFLGYGISDKLALEFEAAYISAELEKPQEDMSAMPAKIKKSGGGDVEGQIRWRWNYENAKTPEFFTYFETVFPTDGQYSLIGTPDWELKLGTGLIKGFRWGTVTLRGGAEYAADDGSTVAAGGLEYLKRISNRFRFFAMFEGTKDDISFIPEMQWHFSRHAFLKINNGFGVTSSASDFAPEVGVMFSFFP